MKLSLNGLDIFKSSKVALLTLFFLSFIYFLESFDRYLISVSPIPYIDYSSYEYSILTGPAFTVIYTFSGLTIALLYSQDSQLSFCNISKFNVLAIATFIFSVSFAVTALATSFYQQVLIRVVMGVTQSIITPFSTAIISDIFPSHVKGSAFAIFNVGTYIAFSMSLSLGTYLFVSYGWRAGYLIFGLLGAACALPIPLLVRFNRSTRLEDVSGCDEDSRGEFSDGVGPVLLRRSDVYSPLTDSDISSSIEESGADDQKCLTSDGGGVVPTPRVSTWYRMRRTLHEVCCVHWRRRPELYLVCLATGVRLGGGYIWSAYTSVFFSSLFVAEDPAHGCSFSFSATAALSSLAGGAVCGGDFPYCVEGGDHCSALAVYPWHNQGMSSLRLEEFMSWVPLVGSGLGSLLGGFLSDHLVATRRHSASQGLCDEHSGDNNDDHSAVRMLVAGVGTLLAVPLVLLALLLDFPYCFLVMVGSGMVGEAYLSQALAVVTSERSVPARLVTQSVAVFMLVITLIGGNLPLLVPVLLSRVGFDAPATVHFQAAPMYSSAAGVVLTADTVAFSVVNSDARQLQFSMMYLLGITYGLSGLLYIACYFMMKIKAVTAVVNNV